MKSRLQAVVFDFDGVIVNTEPLHYAAFREILEPLALSFRWDEYVSYYLGFDDRDAFREVFERSGRAISGVQLSRLIDAKAQAFQRLVKEKGAKPFPGVVPLIKSLSGKVPLALCSGALKRDIEPILRRLGISRVFDAVVTADDVKASKPNPASYVLALKQLTNKFPALIISPKQSVAIEDTPAGIEAALAAGLTVLALSNSYGPTKLQAAKKVMSSLKGITWNQLALLVTSPEDDGAR